MHNDSDGDSDDDNNNDDNHDQDFYIYTAYHDKITQHTLHQTLRSTIKIRSSKHSVMCSDVSAFFV
jgi:hypothetical protein